MAAKQAWQRLLDPKVLARGWHLARADIGQDFAEDLYSADIFAVDLALRLQEMIQGQGSVRSVQSLNDISRSDLLE